MEARFTEVNWVGTRLSFHATVDSLSELLFVDLPPEAERPSDDLIAVFFAVLAGPGLANLQMDLAVTPEISAAIERFCGCKLAAERVDPAEVEAEREGLALSFSGGFDSLAAKALLPGSPALISMDFGGWFQRETDYFERFDPYIVRTNFRMAGFGRRSWMFMLAGVILLRDTLGIRTYSTGSILESSPWHYRRNLEGMPGAHPLLSALGLRQLNPTIGITEVATTMLTMRHFPDEVAASLKSLAAPTTGKSLRKQMLVATLHRRGRVRLDYEPSVAEFDTPPLRWGQSLTDDMLTPYMLRHAGESEARSLMADIPDAVVELAESATLSFYERYHTGLYQRVAPSTMRHVRNTFAAAGIEPFAERDWVEYRAVIEILRRTHDLPGS